jgi:hypothetical protein
VVCPDGGVGLLVDLRAAGLSGVTFGSGGPVRLYNWRTLRPATVAEIEDAGLSGVGCNQGYMT